MNPCNVHDITYHTIDGRRTKNDKLWSGSPCHPSGFPCSRWPRPRSHSRVTVYSGFRTKVSSDSAPCPRRNLPPARHRTSKARSCFKVIPTVVAVLVARLTIISDGGVFILGTSVGVSTTPEDVIVIIVYLVRLLRVYRGSARWWGDRAVLVVGCVVTPKRGRTTLNSST